MVDSVVRRCTHSKTKNDGYHPAQVESLVPKHRKRARKTQAPTVPAPTMRTRSPSRQGRPPLLIAEMQKIGAILQINPEDISAEKLNALPGADQA